MSIYFQAHRELYSPEYDDGRTKQSFKDSCDINKILARFSGEQVAAHLSQFKNEYGDFSEFDWHKSQLLLARGNEIFDALPPSVKREFGQQPSEFFNFVNDPKNQDRLAELLPELARPGLQLPDVRGSTPPGASVPAPQIEPADASPPATNEDGE
tara:strand:- start:2431 stop:2895 length:465 start_codon:yes stop_codon:yes gene_type:complete